MDIHVLLYFVGLCFPKLSESVCNYRQIASFKQKYFRDYNGKDIPEIRCDKLGGHCLRYKEKCNGRNEFWQTSCDHVCDCCLKVGSRRRERTKHWLLMRRKLNWKDAEEYCEVKRGDLLVPENVWDLIEFLRHEDIGNLDVWVGINDAYKGRFEGIHHNPVESDAWQRGQPRKEASSSKNCVVVEDKDHDEGLKVEPCIAQNYFICDFNKDRDHKFDVDLIKRDDAKSNTDADTSAAYGKGVRIGKERKSWSDARKDCQANGGDLHIPAYIVDMVLYMRKLDIGSRDVWIGYSDHYDAGKFVGIQGNEIEGGWMKDQPQSVRSGDDCLVVEESKDNGYGMKVDDCEDKNFYACDFSDDYRSRHSTKA